MKKTIVIFLFFVVAFLTVNKLSSKFLIDRTSYELPYGINVSSRFTFVPLLNFDGRNYLDISIKGYFDKNGHNLNVFFPAYPFLIKIMTFDGLLNPVYIGLLISSSAFIGIIFMVNKMYGMKVLTLLLAFPTSFFFLTFYTESLFLFLVIMFFYFLKKKDYLMASIFASIASGTRIMGIVLAPIIIYEIVKNEKDIKKNIWSILIAPAGFILYFLTVGTSIFSGQRDWNREVGLLGPFRALSDSLAHVFQGPLPNYDNNFVYPIIVLEFVIFILAVLTVVKMRNQVDNSYYIYSVAGIILILLGGSLASSPRYLLVIFPIFIYLAKKLKGVYYYTYILISAMLLILFSSLFLRGYWVA